ncbi:outer membrane protein [Candidatus Nucleicultrix amoebiphila]|jgi:opacity protein-like surface antigen|uniref:Outer membrane protein beta-barrel domain-containing protein n=1 Tax=Candidatus Nucleicultrix amoebiphila FS5 TaxID=1414854 RepID=A0A1W6N476_9PROT|nr:outer membrane beta-barrel protein [Candidatus Nucleicultrix amoebiphila]ARN84622.1 hypothetical protein GQ61_04065 [Candidatus Nucleicultrix amoebiphila FS5]
MKKSSFKVLLLTAITASSPLMAVSSHFYKPGFYAGLAAGHSYMRSDVKESVFIPALINTNGSGTAKKHGVVGEILGGYRYFFANGFLTGLELGMAVDSNRTEKNLQLDVLRGRSTLKSSFKFMPALVLGKQFSDRWLGFVKLGASINRFKGSHEIYLANRLAASENFKATKAGIMIGVGVEYAFSDKFSTVATLGYENYGNIKQSYKTFTGPAFDKNSGGFKPSYVTTKVGFIYKF